jgi:uncharacterized membrane protein HdeD (DUF308 family)
MSRLSVRLLGITLLLAGAFTMVAPIRTHAELDSCLDAGGSYDYSNAQCDHQASHQRVTPSVPIWVRLGGAIALALAGGVLLVFSRRISSEPDAV